jgi:hypothetical protein
MGAPAGRYPARRGYSLWGNYGSGGNGVKQAAKLYGPGTRFSKTLVGVVDDALKAYALSAGQLTIYGLLP